MVSRSRLKSIGKAKSGPGDLVDRRVDDVRQTVG